MEGQWTDQIAAWNYSQSIHYTFTAQSAIVQIALSTREDFAPEDDSYGESFYGGLAPAAQAGFHGFKTSDAPADWVPFTVQGIVGYASTFAADNLTEVWGTLTGRKCLAVAFVNVFFW